MCVVCVLRDEIEFLERVSDGESKAAQSHTLGQESDVIRLACLCCSLL